MTWVARFKVSWFEEQVRIIPLAPSCLQAEVHTRTAHSTLSAELWTVMIYMHMHP
jgi:hypothetical protein